MRIEQAVYGGQDAGGYRFLARSAGFAEAWLPAAERLCTGFGERPAGVACPMAVFAQRLDAKHVAVVQVADQGRDDAGRPGALAFRLLVLTRAFYADLEGDPFRIADRFPPDWGARGEAPTLEWTAGPPPRRTVEDVRRVLDVEAERLARTISQAPPAGEAIPPDLPAERTALLLGATQALVDGGRVVFRRNEPDPTLVRQLWTLLPTSTRMEVWPASFAFGNKHRFHLAVVPEAAADDFADYVKEAEAGDYPEGRYESSLQHAAEARDQAEIDRLLARPSSRQRFKLLLGLLAVFALVPLLINLPLGPATPEQADPPEVKRPPEPTPVAALRLPAEQPLAPKDPRRRELRDGINRLARKLGVPQAEGLTDAEMVAMLRAFDRKLGEAPRPVGGLESLNDPRSLIRAILWEHGSRDYAEPALNVEELLERLEQTLAGAKLLPKGDR